jgi:hypothetical protein
MCLVARRVAAHVNRCQSLVGAPVGRPVLDLENCIEDLTNMKKDMRRELLFIRKGGQ